MPDSTPAPDSDFELLQAWRDGDVQAGEDLFARHFEGLCRFFRNKISEGVDDLIQRTFLLLVERRDQFEGRSSFRTYLFVVARNELYRELGTRRRAAEKFDPLEVSVVEISPSPPSVMARKREERALLEALRRIPLEHQVTLELYFWEEMTAGAIGEVLEVPEGTVRTRIRRARALLAQELASLEAGGAPLHTTDANIDQWARSVKKVVESS